jgi:predicted transglutaminase-like cysteine proteinase
MGQAKIIGVVSKAIGKYDIEIVKDPGKSVARQAAIVKELEALEIKITAAVLAVSAAETNLTASLELLNKAIAEKVTVPPSLVATRTWPEHGNGKCEKIFPSAPQADVGIYLITCNDVGGSPVYAHFSVWGPYFYPLFADAEVGKPYTSNHINFTITQGSIPFETGDGFRIEVTEANCKPLTPLEAAKTVNAEAQTALTMARRTLSMLRLQRTALNAESLRLTQAMAAEYRTGVWCADLTTDLAVGNTVGTMEMNGEGCAAAQIILAPGGLVSKSIGKLQHVGVSSPSATFLNLAKLPGWQKWKPNYRVGEILAIWSADQDPGDTTLPTAIDKCHVGIEPQRSSQQGLLINQAGEDYTATKNAIAGFTAFAAANPDNPLVTNTLDTTLTSSPALLADLAKVQADIQNRYTYKTDTEQYGKLENWQIMAPGGSGDCEDFALTKAMALIALGYPASAIKIEVGTEPVSGQGHAWLVVQTDKGDLALDNRYLTVQKNDTTPYTARQRQTGTAWAQSKGVKLKNVPIEYMDGMNSDAFVVADRVVVQFTGQDWTKPKVIGFETEPREEIDNLIVLQCEYGWVYYMNSWNNVPLAYHRKVYSVSATGVTALLHTYASSYPANPPHQYNYLYYNFLPIQTETWCWTPPHQVTWSMENKQFVHTFMDNRSGIYQMTEDRIVFSDFAGANTGMVLFSQITAGTLGFEGDIAGWPPRIGNTYRKGDGSKGDGIWVILPISTGPVGGGGYKADYNYRMLYKFNKDLGLISTERLSGAQMVLRNGQTVIYPDGHYIHYGRVSAITEANDCIIYAYTIGEYKGSSYSELRKTTGYNMGAYTVLQTFGVGYEVKDLAYLKGSNVFACSVYHWQTGDCVATIRNMAGGILSTLLNYSSQQQTYAIFGVGRGMGTIP